MYVKHVLNKLVPILKINSRESATFDFKIYSKTAWIVSLHGPTSQQIHPTPMPSYYVESTVNWLKIDSIIS